MPSRYRRLSGVQTRLSAGSEALLVFTPSRSNIFTLNLTAGVILELCEGRTFEEMLADFSQRIPPATPPTDAAETLRHGLSVLGRKRACLKSSEDERVWCMSTLEKITDSLRKKQALPAASIKAVFNQLNASTIAKYAMMPTPKSAPGAEKPSCPADK